MKRNEWKFTYTASQLAEAATNKQAHHAERLAWWEQKKKEVAQRVTESGIEVHDAVASEYGNHGNMRSMTATGINAFGPEIRIDAGLQRDLSECQGKINRHAMAMKEYAGWQEVLSGNPGDRLDLEHDDYLFFFGK